MVPFTVHTGVAAPLLRPNIDTDVIIPSREMKRVSKKGLGEGLFAGWRYTEPGGRDPKPGFVLNQPAYAGCSILLGGDNFGCGSSREHAVWALAEFGVRAIVAPGFASIFYANCTRNGILPVVLEQSVVQSLASQVAEAPQEKRLTIDLTRNTLLSPDGVAHSFSLDDEPREMLLEGLDPIALTGKQSSVIDAYEQSRKARYSWLYETT